MLNLRLGLQRELEYLKGQSWWTPEIVRLFATGANMPIRRKKLSSLFLILHGGDAPQRGFLGGRWKS